MVELKIPIETIESIFSRFSIWGDRSEIIIEWQNNEMETYDKNQENFLFKAVHKDDYLFRIEDQVIKSPFEGYVFLITYYNRLKLTKEEAENKVIGIVCEELDEAIRCLVGPTDCTLTIDPYTQKK